MAENLDPGKGAQRPNRLAFGLAAAALSSCLSACFYNSYASRHIARETEETERNPNSGIAKKAQPIELGEGRKRSVLLVHGFAASPADFGRLPEALGEAGWHVAAPLLPGHGRKPTDLATVTVEEMAEHVRQAYVRLCEESDSVAVVGFSMGGALSLRLFREVGRKPDALVLASPYVRIGYRWWHVLPARTWNAILAPFVPYAIRSERFTPVNRREALGDIFSYRALSTRFVKQLVRLGKDIRENPPAAAPRNTLLLYGRDDRIVSLKAMRLMADRLRIPKEARIELPRSDHIVFHDHDREEAIERTVKFLGESL